MKGAKFGAVKARHNVSFVKFPMVLLADHIKIYQNQGPILIKASSKLTHNKSQKKINKAIYGSKLKIQVQITIKVGISKSL